MWSPETGLTQTSIGALLGTSRERYRWSGSTPTHRIGISPTPALRARTGSCHPVVDGHDGGMSTPVIIEAAINGGTRRERQPHVPLTPAETAADGLECLTAGAAIVHQHDGPRGADATLSLESYRTILASYPQALLYPTARIGDASDGPGIHGRWDHHLAIDQGLREAGLPRLRVALVDPGSVTLGNFVYGHTTDDIAYKFGQCHDLGYGPSIACFEPGFIRRVLEYREKGLLPAGSLVKLYFSGGHPLFGLPPTPWAFDTYFRLIEGTGLNWAVAVLGGDVVSSGLAQMAIDRGGHVRVGLEDFHSPDRTPHNAELVAEVADLARASGRGVASCAEAATILGLP